VTSSYPDEEVDHEEDVEREVDLLSGAVCPLLTRFNRLTATTTPRARVLTVACVTCKTISTNEPAYLHSLLKHYVPSRSLRSSDSNLLSVPRVRTCFGSRSFAVAAPTIWNTPPP